MPCTVIFGSPHGCQMPAGGKATHNVVLRVKPKCSFAAFDIPPCQSKILQGLWHEPLRKAALRCSTIIQAKAVHPQLVQPCRCRQGFHHRTDRPVGTAGIQNRICFIPPVFCRKMNQTSAFAHRVNIPASAKGNFLQTVQAIRHILPIPCGILLLKLCQRQRTLAVKPVAGTACNELAKHRLKAGQIQNIL